MYNYLVFNALKKTYTTIISHIVKLVILAAIIVNVLIKTGRKMSLTDF